MMSPVRYPDIVVRGTDLKNSFRKEKKSNTISETVGGVVEKNLQQGGGFLVLVCSDDD